jgi:hypothetical protein
MIGMKSKGSHTTIYLVDNVNDSDFIKDSKYKISLISVLVKWSYYMNMDRTKGMGCNLLLQNVPYLLISKHF